MAIPVIIVTGFLGCGKTSFLRHLLPLCGESSLRPALVINEVGEVDVDGELLSDLHAEQARLVGGCVCCTLQAQLSSTIDELLQQKLYDLIVIECSGLSNPMDVVGVLGTPYFLDKLAVSHIVCLVDASRAEKMLAVAEIAKAQVAAADILLLNKADCIAEERRPEIEALTRALNTQAKLHWGYFGDIGPRHLRALLRDPAPLRYPGQCPHEDHAHHQHELPASFCTVALPLPAQMSRSTLESLLASLPGNVVRAKGFACVEGEGWQVLHRVYDSCDLYPYTGTTPGTGPVLICIGQHLQPRELENLVFGLV